MGYIHIRHPQQPRGTTQRRRRLGLEALESRHLLTTFEINVLSDLVDADPNDGVIDVDLEQSGQQISLRAAVDAANESPEDDEIILPAGLFELTLENGINLEFVGDLDVGNTNESASQGQLFIRGDGQGRTVISSSTRDPERVFDVLPGASLHLSELTVRDGRQDSGGNIRNMGELTLEHVTVANGFAFHEGGGIQNLGGTITIKNSELLDSRSQELGGALSNEDGVVTIMDTTVSSNEANVAGGGLFTQSGSVQITSSTFDSNVSGDKGGAIHAEGSLSLLNSTLTGNIAIDGAGVYVDPLSESVGIVHSTIVRNVGAGITTALETSLTLSHTVVAQNIIEDGRSPGDVQGIVTSEGHNLIGDGTNLSIRNESNTDLIGEATTPIDPMLNPLQDNGGFTETHLPLAGSPLVDAGADQAVLETDQRGQPRPRDANGDGAAISDIGAVEVGGIRATTDYYAGFEDSLLVGSPSVLANDTDTGFQSATLKATLASSTTQGMLEFFSDGTFRYQPDENFSGFDEFTYVAMDEDFTSVSILVTIFIFPVDDEPIVMDDLYRVNEDQVLRVSVGDGVLANDADVDDEVLAAAILVPPSHGQLELNSDGSFQYEPNINFFGTDQFDYVARDGRNASTATAIIEVSPVPDPPTAVNDAYTVDACEELHVGAENGLLQNDEDVDGDDLRVLTIEAPMNGTLLQQGEDGSFVYLPNENFDGTDTFSYTITDGQRTDTALVTITVLPKELARLSGKSWSDVNANGIVDEGDSGLQQRTIVLLDFDTGLQLDVTTTDENGDYEFLVPAGKYSVEQVPVGLEQTFPLRRFDTVVPVGPQQEFVTRDIVAADFNSDGHADLATVNDISNTVAIRFSDAVGGFGQPVLIDVDVRPTALVALDVDGDLDQDLVVVTIGRPETSPPSESLLTVLKNEDGRLSPSRRLSVDSGPIDVVSADFDGDNAEDLAIVSFRQRTVTIFKNASSSFVASASFGFDSNPTKIEAIHINADEAIDLVVAEEESDELTMLSNDGNGNFAASKFASAVRVPSDLLSADLNRDGRDDLIVIGFESDTLSIFFGDDSSGLGANPPETIPIRQGTNSVPTEEDRFFGKMVHVEDVNEDSAPDLVVVGEPSTAATFFNLGDGKFTRAVFFENGADPSAVGIANVDNDGDLDLATTSLAAGVTTLRNAVGRYEGIVAEPRQTLTGFDFGNLPLEIVVRQAALSTFVAYDVNFDGTVTARDVLAITNAINDRSSKSKPDREILDAKYDVNGDGFVTSIDALLIINYLNNRADQ